MKKPFRVLDSAKLWIPGKVLVQLPGDGVCEGGHSPQLRRQVLEIWLQSLQIADDKTFQSSNLTLNISKEGDACASRRCTKTGYTEYLAIIKGQILGNLFGHTSIAANNQHAGSPWWIYEQAYYSPIHIYLGFNKHSHLNKGVYYSWKSLQVSDNLKLTTEWKEKLLLGGWGIPPLQRRPAGLNAEMKSWWPACG